MGLAQTLKVARFAGQLALRRVAGAPARETAAWARGELPRLGPVAVKLGQLLAAREDAVGPEWAAALRSLQADVDAPAAPAQADEQARADLAPVAHELAAYEPRPVATASVARVYRARLHDGRDVAVKVKRAGIDAAFAHDLAALRLASLGVALGGPAAREAAAALEQCAEALRAELDFRREAADMLIFAERVFAHDELLLVPRPVLPLCTDRVLVADFVDGRRVGAGAGDAAAARALMRASFRGLIEHGCLHADLHAGNLIALPPAPGSAAQRLAVLDFGQVARLPAPVAATLKHVMFSLVEGDAERTADLLLLSGAVAGERARIVAFTRAAIQYMHHADVARMRDDLLRDLGPRAEAHGVAAHASVLQVLRSMTLLEGCCRELDPAYNLESAVRELASEYLLEYVDFRARRDIFNFLRPLLITS